MEDCEDTTVVCEATLCIEVFVNCPHCDYLVDLLDPEDTSGYYHNDCGEVLRQACPEGHWSEQHASFKVEEVTCSECSGVFTVHGLQW